MDGSTPATAGVTRKTDDAYTSGREAAEEENVAAGTEAEEPPSLYFSRRSRPVDFKYVPPATSNGSTCTFISHSSQA